MQRFKRYRYLSLTFILKGAIFFFFQAAPVQSAPTGGKVVHGNASFSHSGNTTSIQAGNNAIIQYQDFSIKPNESVEFIQPTPASRVFNRVVGSSPSSIEGKLFANGQVYLVNPNGIFFGGNAIVDVAGLYAAAAHLSNEDFLSHINRFTDISGNITNLGRLQGNELHLIGQKIANMGQVIAPEGAVTFSSGKTVLIGKDQGHLFVKIEDPGGKLHPETPAIENSGEVVAKKVLFSSGDLYSLAIKNRGLIKANEIELVASNTATLDIGGTLKAEGGSVTLLADKIQTTGAKIDVSSKQDGGSIRIGGGLRGKEGLKQATATYIDKETELLADSLETGTGGTIVVWAKGWTRFDGKASAKGGLEEGNGGFIEISGKDSLYYQGETFLDAPNGKVGTLLFDPANITIVDGGPAADDGSLPDLSNATVGFAGNFFISENALEALGAGANLILEATDTITLQNLSDNTLNLAIGGGGSVTITADTDLNGVGDFIMADTGDTFQTAGANVTISGASLTLGDLNTGGGAANLTASAGSIQTQDVTSGALTANATNGINLSGNVTAGGITTLNADSDDNGAGVLTLGGALNTTGNNLNATASDFTLTGSINTGAGNTNLTASTGVNIGLGSAAPGFDISGAELGNITATNLTVTSQGGGNITTDTVSAANTANISGLTTLASANNAVFSGGNSTWTNGLTVTSTGTTQIGVDLTTNNGAMTFSNNALLTANVVLTDTGAQGITFSGTLDSSGGARDLTTNSTGNVTFTGNVGSGSRLASYTSNAGGQTLIDGGNFLATGNITFNDNVVFGAGGGQTVDSSTGALTAVGSLAKAAGNLTLGGDTDIDLQSTVNAAGTLTLNTSQTVDLGVDNGATIPLTNAVLTNITAQNLTINTAAQIRSDGVTAGATGNITTTTTLNSTGSSVDFVNSGSTFATNLTVTANTGVTIDQPIDTSNNNQNFTTPDFDLNSTLDAGTGDITLTGGNNVDINLVGAGAEVGAIDISNATLQNITAANLTLNARGNGVIDVDGVTAVATGNISTLITLDAQAGDVDFTNNPSVFSTGLTAGTWLDIDMPQDLTTAGPTTLFADTNNNGTGTVTISGALNTGGNNLDITGDDLVLTGSINTGAGNLTILATDDQNIRIGPAGSGMDISGAELALMTVGGNIDFQTTNGGDVYFNGISAANMANITGNVLFNPADQLFISGGNSTINNTIVATPGTSSVISADLTSNTGGITFNNPVFLNADVQISETSGQGITFNSTIDSQTLGTPRDLTITTAAGGDVVLNGAIGATNPLDQLIINPGAGGNIELRTGTVNTSGNMNWGGPLILYQDTNMDSLTGGSMTFTSTIDSDGTLRDLTLDTLTVDFQGVVGLTTSALDVLTVNAENALNITNDIRAQQITLHAGNDGTGDLTFAAGVDLHTDNLSVIAGDGTGGAAGAVVDVVNNAPTFHAFAMGATSPATYTMTQDAAFNDTDLAAIGQFSGGIAGMTMNLNSRDANITLNDGTDVAGTNLFLNGQTGVITTAALSVASIDVTGVTSLGADVTATGNGIFRSNVTLTTDVIVAGVDMTFSGTIDSDATPRDLILNATGNTLLSGSIGATNRLDTFVTDGNGTTELAGASILTNNNLTILETFTLTNAGNQTLDSNTGTLRIDPALTKATGDLSLGGGGAIDINNSITINNGSLTIDDNFNASNDLTASQNVTLSGSGTLDGGGAQRIDAVAGTLVTQDLTKANGDLTLGGATAIDINGTVDATADSLVIEDAFSATNNLTAGTNVTLSGAGTLDGAGAQRIDAVGGTLQAVSTLTKANNNLTLGGGTAIDLNATVDATNNDLIIEDNFNAAANLTAGQNLTLSGNGTLDGAGAQRVDAVAGTLVTQALTKAAGDLTLGGGTAIDINGSVDATTNNLLIEDNFTASNNLTAGNNVTFNGNGTLDGGAAQRVDAVAGTLTTQALTKANGDLTLGGGTAIDLNGNIDATNDSLIIEDAFAASNNVTAGTNLTLSAAATLDGAGAQRIDAVGGTLTTSSTVTKANGDLTLGGGTAIDLNATVDATNDNLIIEDAFSATNDVTAGNNVTLNGAATLDGAGAQRIDAVGGTLTAQSTIIKANGVLTLGGGTAIDLNNNVEATANNLIIEDPFTAAGNLISGQDLNLSAAATLDGAGAQRIDAIAGTLTMIGLTKANGDLTLGGGTAIDINGSIDTTNDSLLIEDPFSASGDLTAGTNVTFNGAATLDGGAAQRVDAVGGTLTAQAITKANGNLTLGGGTAIDLNGNIDATNNDLIIEDPFNASNNLTAGNNVTFNGAGTLDGGAAQRVDAVAGTLTTQALTKANGDLTLGGGNAVDLNGNIEATADNLVIEDPFTASNNLIAGTNITLNNTATLDGGGAQRVDAIGGTLTVSNTLTKANGDLTLAGGTAIDINAAVQATNNNLIIEDPFTANNDLIAGQSLTLSGAGTLDGGGAQRVDAQAGTLTTLALTKANGNLTLGGGTAIDINGNIDATNNDLIIEDPFTASNDLTAGNTVTLNGVGTLDGAAGQRIDAVAGTLTTQALTKALGNLNLGGGTAIDVNGTLQTTVGTMVIEDGFTATNDLLAGTNLTINTSGVLDGGGNQRVDAVGGVLLTVDITKPNGDLVLAGAGGVDLNAFVDVQAGSLTIEDTFNATQNVTAATNVTLMNNGTLDGAGAQRVDAVAGTLITQNLTKANGNLTLGGGTAVDINGTVDATNNDLIIEDPFNAFSNLTAGNNVTFNGAGTLDGPAAQRIDAVAGTLTTQALTKANGDLTLGGGTAIDINGNVDATNNSLTIEDPFNATNNLTGGADVTLSGAGTLDGGGNQRIDAVAGTLTTQALTKATGNLALGGGTALDINGNVNVTLNDLDIEDAFTATGDLIAGNDTTFNAGATLDGGGNQRVDAVAGTLSTQAITKAAGDLTLGGAVGITLAGTVNNTGGSVTIEDAFSASMDVLANINLILSGSATLTGGGAQRLDAVTGALSAANAISKANGDLTIGGALGIDLNGNVTTGAGSITIEDAFNAAMDVVAQVNLLLSSNAVLDGAGAQRLDAVTGDFTSNGTITKAVGNLTIGGANSIDINQTVTVTTGSLIIEDTFTATNDLIAGQDFTLNGNGILDGGGAQRVDATAGTLTTLDLTKANGDLTLGGGTAIDINGTVTATNDGLTVEDAFSLTGDLTAGTLLSIQGNGTLDGVGNQNLQGQTIAVNANTLQKTTAGDLIFNAGVSTTFSGGTLTSSLDDIIFNGDVILNGALQLNAVNITVNQNLDGANDLTLNSSGVTTVTGAVGGTTPLGDGTGAALTLVSTGTTTFASTLNLNSGIVQQVGGGDITFNGNVTASGGDTASTFNENVIFNSVNFLSAPGATFGSSNADTLTLNGAANSINTSVGNTPLTINATVDGATDLTLAAGSGAITLNGDLGLGTSLLDFTATGGSYTQSGKLTASQHVFIRSGSSLTVSGDIDPLTISLLASDNITIISNLVASNAIRIFAGTDGSGTVSHSGGWITAPNVDIDAASGILGGFIDGQNLAFDATTGNINLSTRSATDAILNSLTTGSGTLTLTHSGTGSLTTKSISGANGDIFISSDASDLITSPDLTTDQLLIENGNIILKTVSSGSIYIGYLENLFGNVSLNAADSIQDAQDDLELDVLAFSYDLTAGIGIGGLSLIGNTIDPEGRVELGNRSGTLTASNRLVAYPLETFGSLPHSNPESYQPLFKSIFRNPPKIIKPTLGNLVLSDLFHKARIHTTHKHRSLFRASSLFASPYFEEIPYLDSLLYSDGKAYRDMTLTSKRAPRTFYQLFTQVNSALKKPKVSKIRSVTNAIIQQLSRTTSGKKALAALYQFRQLKEKLSELQLSKEEIASFDKKLTEMLDAQEKPNK